jgi:hypothetical protein
MGVARIAPFRRGKHGFVGFKEVWKEKFQVRVPHKLRCASTCMPTVAQY